MLKIFLSTILLITASIASSSPFKVDGDTIYYDTENTEGIDEIDYGHEEELLNLLKKHEGIKTIVLNSHGGFIEPAQDMSSLIIDANLNTYVEFECARACVAMFLGGKNRALALGGKLGFHKSYWETDSIKEYYESEKEDQKWSNPFEFASWLYEDTQKDIFKKFEYLLQRDVLPRFAIETLKAGSVGMWYPRRKELLKGGVLTE